MSSRQNKKSVKVTCATSKPVISKKQKPVKGGSGRSRDKSKRTIQKSYGKAALEGGHVPSPTVACTDEQYEEIVRTMWDGSGKGGTIRANKQCAIMLQTEANTGLRIGDVVCLRLDDIIYDGANQRYKFYYRENKTEKLRTYTIPTPCYKMLANYAKANGIANDQPLFSIGVREVQKKLQQVVDYLGYENIGSHSFRKYAATRLYQISGYDIEMVRKFLQHSSSAVTMRYIGIQDAKFEKCIRKMVNIVVTY